MLRQTDLVVVVSFQLFSNQQKTPGEQSSDSKHKRSEIRTHSGGVFLTDDQVLCKLFLLKG